MSGETVEHTITVVLHPDDDARLERIADFLVGLGAPFFCVKLVSKVNGKRVTEFGYKRPPASDLVPPAPEVQS